MKRPTSSTRSRLERLAAYLANVGGPVDEVIQLAAELQLELREEHVQAHMAGKPVTEEDHA